MAAVVWLWGPPWRAGKTARSMALASSARQRIIAPRGPRRVLWGVVVVTAAVGGGVGGREGENEAGDVGDVGEEVGADLAGDLADELEVEQTRVSRSTGD